MKIKEGFILRKVGNMNIVVAIGQASESFNAMITLNTTGAFLWEALSKSATEDELLCAMLEKYDIDKETAKADISEFLTKMKEHDLLEK